MSAAAAKPIFEFAPSPYVIRAAEKDDFYQKHLAENVEDTFTRLLGTRWVNRYEQELRLAAYGGYYLLATTGGRQTLGEEYCDLMQVNAAALRPPTNWHRSAQIMLHVCIPYLLEKWLPVGLARITERTVNHRVQATQLALKSAVREFQRFHLAIFFIFGSYYHVSYRATKTRMLLMNRTRQGLSSYTELGFMILIQQVIEGIQAVRQLLKKRREAAQRAAEGRRVGDTREEEQDDAEEDEADDDADDGGASERCSLCLGVRGGRNGPTTATICGHLFCWNCVTGLCRTNPSPVCPLCRERITAQTLAPVFRYRSS
ncbi:Peroxisome biogenesis factor 10 [Diplonema papillatum]|nr:Peroxisome biogenesis factor 10 [Diplonema papillatum]